jgi:hypothetical protein
MANADLETLRGELVAMPAEAEDQPAIPMAVVLQEAADLLAVLRIETVKGRLVQVGASAESFDRLQVAIEAARAAQSDWVVVRDASKSNAQRDREAAGQKLRLDLLAACRWNRRGDRVALGTLSDIAEGEGVADLIQDLNDLAALIELKRGEFGVDKDVRGRGRGGTGAFPGQRTGGGHEC